jgi:hypothetical protein
MKKIITLTLLLVSILSFAQVPQGISYQAIALNNSGNPVVSSNVGIRLSVVDNSATGTVLYTETHTKTTNTQGLFNLVIGQGTVTTGTFSTINWSTNSKFLKVEMDIAGGTNYVLVGATQLLSVPYAMAADSLITSPGEGITLVSPNGTPYQVTVNDSGQLSLPTAGTNGSIPSVYYMYGTFNNYTTTNALLMSNDSYTIYGYKYLTSGTEIKFLAGNNPSSQIYGVDSSLLITANGSPYTITSNGFYYISLENAMGATAINRRLNTSSIAPTIKKNPNGSSTTINATYNSTTNVFSFTLTGIINSDNFAFNIQSQTSSYYGDNLADGSIEQGGTYISFPTATSTPKNYRVDLTINFNGSGTYTITQIP